MFASLFLAAIVLRALYLDGQGLWFDEGVGLVFSTCENTAGCIERMVGTHTSERFQFVHPVLLHWWRELFGSSEVALRSLSALFGIAALPLTWLTALRLFGKGHAVWTLAFMATSAFTVFHAQEARPYTLFLFLAALQLHLLVVAMDGSRRARVALCVATFVASWVGLFPLLFTVALALADLGRRSFRDVGRWFMWWLPVGLICVPAVIYYVMAALDAPPTAITVPKSNQPWLNLMFMAYGQLVGQTFGPSVQEMRNGDLAAALWGAWPELLIFAAVAAAVTLRAAWLVLRGAHLPGGSDERRLLVWTAISFVGLSFIFMILTKHNWLPRHAIALHPVLALLLPLVIGKPAPSGRWQAWALLPAAIIALNLLSLGQHYFSPRHGKDDYRGAVAYAESVNGAGRPVVLLRGLPVLVRYYGLEDFVDATDVSVGRLRGALPAMIGDSPEFILIVNRPYDFNSLTRIDQALEGEFRRISSQRSHYIEVGIYQRRR